MSLYKKCTSSFLVNDTILSSNRFLSFRQNLLERIQKLIMTIDDKITYQKLQCVRDNREEVKMSALLLDKTFAIFFKKHYNF